MENVKKEKVAKKSRSTYIIQWWNEGFKTKAEIATKLHEIENNGTLVQKKTSIIRDEKFFVGVANWYITQLARAGKIDYVVAVRKPRVKKAEAPVVEETIKSEDVTVVSTSEETEIPTL